MLLTGISSSVVPVCAGREDGVFPGRGEMPGNRIVEFFQQQGNALTAPAPVADGIFNHDLLRRGPVPEEYLHRVAYGALVRVVVVDGELPVFRHLHPVPERVDTGIGSGVILVILGGQASEDQGEWRSCTGCSGHGPPGYPVARSCR